MIRFSCPGCGAVYSVDDAKGGKTGKCPKCQTQFQIPLPEGAAAPPPLPASAPEPAASLPPPPSDPNAPVEIEPCPGCQARLSVAAADLGADVECPYCKRVYKAVQAGGRPPAPSRRPEPDEAGGRPRRRAEEDEDDRPSRRRRRDEDELDDERPSRRRRVEEDEEDDWPSRRRRDEEDEEERPRRRDDYDDEYDDRPRRRRRRGATEEAAAAVSVPAIILIVLGILGLVYAVFNVIVVVSGMNVGGPFGGPPKNAAEQAGRYVGMILPVIWGLVVTLGGFKMKSLSGRVSAMVGVIFAMLPCSPCCLIGLPIGIWALVVMNREDVKRAFD